VTAKLFTLLIGIAYRRFRRGGGRIWWAVIIAAFLARAVERHRPVWVRRLYRVRPGRELDIAVSDRRSP
jgi:hypothetical protein